MGLDIDLNIPNEVGDDVGSENNDDFIEECIDVGEEYGHGEDFLGKSLTTTEESQERLEPYPGMEFDSDCHAQSFYLEYAKMTGFAASKITCRRSKVTGEFVDARFACTRFGTKRKTNVVNPRPCPKIDCKAMLHVKKRMADRKWIVMDFVKEHNHELSREKVHYYPCYREISSGDQYKLETLHAVGVKPSKIFAAMAKQAGGYENIGFLEKDMRNHFDKKRRLELEFGDAKAMQELFTKMQEEDSNFFYPIDLDEENRLRNVLWVDAKGREDYKVFGDVVSFDTTYITNKYKMPFAPFVGVNHHFQTALLGCALLADETTSTFVWLMKTWLRAMGGKPPVSILTDQDQAMKAAIAEVFLDVHHRFCLWHILKKFPEKIGSVLKEHENFMIVFNDCIYHSWTEEDFETKWHNLIETFKLAEEDWLHSLFRDREYWVPTYMRDTFFAGMSTTQRSESINAFFDKYVNKKTSLKEFVEGYKAAAQDRLQAEDQAYFSNLYKVPHLKAPSPFGKQMSKIYTLEIFNKFQVEALGVTSCFAIKGMLEDPIMNYRVRDLEQKEMFDVAVDGITGDIWCLCRSFEYKGFLCRHVMVVLQDMGVFCIPDKYILKRWSKNAKDGHTVTNTPREVDPKKQRFDDLFQKARKLSEEGSLSKQRYHIANRALQEALKQCANIKEPRGQQSHIEDVDQALDPVVSSTKGAPKRIKNGVEINSSRHRKQQKKGG